MSLYFHPNQCFTKIIPLFTNIVDDFKLADIICVSCVDISIPTISKYWPKPIIIWERFDSSSLGHSVKFLKYNQVIAVFKDYWYTENQNESIKITLRFLNLAF